MSLLRLQLTRLSDLDEDKALDFILLRRRERVEFRKKPKQKTTRKKSSKVRVLKQVKGISAQEQVDMLTQSLRELGVIE